MMALGTMSRDGSVGDGARDGARSKTPPTTPSKAAAKGKLLGVKVLMLDDSLTLFQVQAKATGKMLFEQVCKQLNLLETDYFGLEYTDNRGSTYWLDRDKPMNQQVGMPGGVDPVLRFMVKFYMPDPSQLEEEYTRYLFSLQIKRDLASGQLQCNENTAALMASYIVQAECGDFVVEDYPDHTYLSTFKFVPGQDAELERRICDNHKKHTGQSPAEADLNLLETARRCELYGTKMHPAKDHEGVPLNLAVAHLGVLVFQNCTKINTFSWAKIRKLSFKRKKFLIKLHPEGYGYYKDIVEFYFDERNQCKNFWKKCVEHHGFFRCTDTPNTVSREKPRIISRGSSFRYSGRTQKQMQEHVRENFVKRQSFQRHVRSLHGSTGNVGSSMSAQPLLPTDSDLAGTPASLSCGSMTLCSDDPHSICSLGSLGHTGSRLRDFDNLDMDSPFSGRRPSSHTAYIPEPTGSHEGSLGSSPRAVRARLFGEPHLPNFHHDHLHHQGQDQLGVATLQPDTQRRERAREALLRRNICDFNVSIDSTQTNSGSSRTTENPTEQTVVQRGVDDGGAQSTLPRPQVRCSTHSLLAAKEQGVEDREEKEEQEDDSQGDHLSSEDNLSHESYDLLEEPPCGSFSDNMKTAVSRSELSFDNSLSYNYAGSIPHTPSKGLVSPGEPRSLRDPDYDTVRSVSLREDVVNSNNVNGHGMSSIKVSHGSQYNSHQSVSGSPEHVSQLEPVSILSRRRSSTSAKDKLRLSKENVCEAKSETRLSSIRDTAHFLSEDGADDFHGHEVHMQLQTINNSTLTPQVSQHQQAQQSQFVRPQQAMPDINRNQHAKQREAQTRDSGMHENFIFQSPTNIKYFSSQIQSSNNSRTLPNRKRREKSPVIFSRGKLSVDCSSASSSSHASPRMCRPKSLDFSVVALHSLPQTTAYSYRDDTIDQQDFDGDSSSTFSVHIENNYASSSDVPQTPEMPELPITIPSKPHISPKPISTLPQKLSAMALVREHERIYDIPEGIERDEVPEAVSPVSESSETKTVFPNVHFSQLPHQNRKFKYLGLGRKFSSEESESTSNRPMRVLPPPKMLKKVSSTESESAPSAAGEVPKITYHQDSDTLSLPLDLLSPPMESESSTALVESESLPAPPQFGSNKDDTDIEDDVTPKGDEMTPDSLDLVTTQRQIVGKGKLLELESQSTIEAFNALAKSGMKPVQKQESSYEARAEKMLESQTTVGSFTEESNIGIVDNDMIEIVDLDRELERQQPINGKRQENLLLKALDTFDSFSASHEFPITRRQESMTYEESANDMLERQTTVDSFTSQVSTDTDVFDAGVNFEANKRNTFPPGRDQILESQSTLESFTTECEVLVTKRQESTYEERAEYLLESQNTIESFTNEVPNEEVFSVEPSGESGFLMCEGETQTEQGEELLVAEMYRRHLSHDVHSLTSLNGDSGDSLPPYLDGDFEHHDIIHGMNALACGQGDKILYNNFVHLPRQQHVETVYLPVTRSSSNSSFEQSNSLPLLDPEEEVGVPVCQDIPQECLDYPTGPYDTDQPPPLPPDEFGNFPAGEPPYYRDAGVAYHPAFPIQRALSRISEHDSGESGSSGESKEGEIEVFEPEERSMSNGCEEEGEEGEEDQNYTTSEDNDQHPSISSDLPENCAEALGNLPANPSFDDVRIEYAPNVDPQPSSDEESPKFTEFTQIDQDTIEEEDLDETNAEEIATEEELLEDLPQDFHPGDLTNSITSDNTATHKDSEGSLHDSMEILEDVNTIDHFEREQEGGDSPAELVVPPAPAPRTLLTKPSVSLSESSGKYVRRVGEEEVIL